MTSDRTEDGPPQGRTQRGRGTRRLDQGDLWGGADESAGATPAPSPRPARRVRQAAPAAPQPPPARSEPVAARPAPAVPVYDDEDDEDDDYWEDPEASLLGNPYVLAAVAVAGAIVLAVIVVFFFGRGDGDSATPGAGAGTTATPTATGTNPTNTIGLPARSIAIATVREGPALSHLELGTLPANQDVDVVGRNEEATWFLIVFPPSTELRGWVPETALRLPDDVSAVVDVVEATPAPRPDLPDPTATTEAPAEVTPTVEGDREGPDIAVAITSDCEPGSEIAVAITNVGTEELDNALIEVIVSNNSIVEYQRPFQAQIPLGATADLGTGVPARAPEMAVIVRLTELDDVDPSNNSASCDVAPGGGNNNSNNNVPPAIGTQNP